MVVGDLLLESCSSPARSLTDRQSSVPRYGSLQRCISARHGMPRVLASLCARLWAN